jgi:chromosome partitioning protein
MLHQDLRIEDPLEFEKFVAVLLQNSGYKVVMPQQNQRGYDIELRRGKECIAVQVKNQRPKVNVAQIQRFQNFLELPLAERFTSGCFLSASGFSNPALTHIEVEQPENLQLGTVRENGAIDWNYPNSGRSNEGNNVGAGSQRDRNEHSKIKYIGVFTCKGGVGKTTVAAHLAGAFALMGYDVILLDLDPDRNLRKLFLHSLEDDEGDASLFVPPRSRGEMGTTITVLNHDQWREEDYPDVKVVICDCSPVLKENPASLVSKFDYCIIPTTLNPLGISKNGDVIIRTFQHIRKCNSKTEMFALINNFDSCQQLIERNRILSMHLKRSLAEYTACDRKCFFIDPDVAKIRYSKSLLYWGYHLIDGSQPQLAFRANAGKNHPRTDFLQLAEYLEDHIDIDKLKEQGELKSL